MKNALVPIMVACAIVGFATILAVIVTDTENQRRLKNKPGNEVDETTIQLLIADPDFYQDKSVRFKTRGLEVRGKTELIYRTHADRPVILIVRCGTGFPTPLPEYITGVCVGKKEEAVIILCK